MMNFNTDKLIRVVFPPFAGGKFLINSLGLSSNCLFQHDFLAKMQLHNKYKNFQIIKYKYLIEKIKESKNNNNWDDLNLGCHQLLGDHYNNNYKPIIANILDSDKYFFIVNHGVKDFIKSSLTWPNSKIILFSNVENFISTRIKSIIKNKPYSINENKPIKECIKSNYFFWNKNFNSTQKLLNQSKKNFYTWDNDNYFSRKTTIKEIKKLYDIFNLSDFRPTIIGSYYDLWTEAIGISEYCDYS